MNMAADHRDLWTTSEYKPAIYIYSDTPDGPEPEYMPVLPVMLIARAHEISRYILQWEMTQDNNYYSKRMGHAECWHDHNT